jgi:hypothetical protein
MPPRKGADLIPFALPLHRRRSGKSAGLPEALRSKEEASFFYTLDLLMEDFGKRHRPEDCALCEPMKVMGKHRDEVMVELNFALFTAFFPSFEGYLAELRDSLMQKFLSRKEGRSHGDWKDKLKQMVQEQIREDAASFLSDILKHLSKFAKVEVEAPRRKKILEQSLQRLKSEWMHF